jgi:hypothetical protein
MKLIRLVISRICRARSRWPSALSGNMNKRQRLSETLIRSMRERFRLKGRPRGTSRADQDHGRVERSIIQERIRAGLARARDEGKQLGRPPIPGTLEKRIGDARSAGLSARHPSNLASAHERRAAPSNSRGLQDPLLSTGGKVHHLRGDRQDARLSKFLCPSWPGTAGLAHQKARFGTNVFRLVACCRCLSLRKMHEAT